MEKKKLLLIAVSLGIFLVIVIGLSILIFAPKKDNPTAYTPTSGDTLYTGSVAITPDTSGASLPATSPITLPDVSAYSDTPARSVETSASSPSITVEVAPPATALSVQTAPSTSAASTTSAQPTTPTTPNVSSGSTSSQQIATKTTPTPVTAAAIQPTTTAPAAQSVTAPASASSRSAPAVSATRQTQPASSAAPTSARKTYESYWVQAGAFSTQIRAEDVKETLKTKGLAAVIETHNAQGRDFYRVRIGPYTSQNEADYWLALIKGIDGFEESQIWQNNIVR